MRLALPAVATAAFAAAALAGATPARQARAASAASPAFQLVFEGMHVPATIPSPSGLMHVGPFTTDAPFCSSGSAADIAFSAPGGQRRFTCASGGDFIALISSFPAEHSGSGSWTIISGTGPLANLRGHGTFTSVHRDDPRDPEAYRSTWQGVAAVDAAPPVIAISGATLRKLARPAGSFTLQLTLSLTDDSAPVSYQLSVADVRRPDAPLASKNGQTASGAVRVALRVRPKKDPRKLVVRVHATDAVDNGASKSLAVAVKRR